MDVDTLVLEAGRMCNMNCPHCLRGKQSCEKMDFEVAKKIMDAFDHIGNITFTGGEPMLYADFIIKCIDHIIDCNLPVAGFYIATNGKTINKELVFKLAELYGYIEEEYGDNYSQLDISTDQFHEKVTLPAYLRAFSFVHKRGAIDPYAVIDEGNARDNGIGYRVMDTEKGFYFEDETSVEMVYVNAKGGLLPDCDYSYETQDEMNPPNVSDIDNSSLLELLKNYHNND